MTTKEIATNLVNLCQQGKFDEVYQNYFSKDAKSIEPIENGTTEGLEAMFAKAKQWEENFEVHSMEIGTPIVADDYFAVTFSLDSTNRHTQERMQSSEIAVYHVKDGKVVSEQFFYDM